MRNFRKITAVIIAVAMVLSLTAVYVFADGEETLVDLALVADKTEIKAGDSFDVSVNLTPKSGAPFVQGPFSFRLKYDKSLFTAAVKSIDSNWEGLSDTNFIGDEPQFGVGTTMIMDGKTMTVAVITFTANNEIKDGTYTIEAVGAYGNLIDYSNGFLADVTNANITVGAGGTETTPAPATPTPGEEATPVPATPTPGGEATPVPATPTPGGETTPAPATPTPGGEATPAPATEAPTEAPTEVPATQPPVDENKVTITIDGSNIPEEVTTLVVSNGDETVEITRDENGNFTYTFDFSSKSTYSVVGIKGKDGDLTLDVANSKLPSITKDSAADGIIKDMVIKQSEGEAAYSAALKGEVPAVVAKADEGAEAVLAKVPAFTITVTKGTESADVVYGEDTKSKFEFRLVDDHDIMVIYDDDAEGEGLAVVVEGTITVQRQIETFGATIESPRPGQPLPKAVKAYPGHYDVATAWYLVSDDGSESEITGEPEAEYRTKYRVKITIVLEHEGKDVIAAEGADYYLNGKAVTDEVAADGGIIVFDYTTSAKSTLGNSGFGTGGPGAASTAAPEASGEPGVVEPTSAPAGAQVFTDVPSTYWAYNYIMDLYNAGLINGYPDGTFLPENNITRAEFTKIAVSVFGLSATSATSQFTDVPATEWYAPYVIAATEAGIVNGISATEFGPDENITREQMATIIGRQLNMASQAAMAYSDVASISEYAVQYVAGLTENGLLQGDDTGRFNPANLATRAEASTLLDRVYVLNSQAQPEPEVSAEPEEEVTPAPEATDNGGFSTGTEAEATPEPSEAPEEA